MSQIRGKNTAPEINLTRILRFLGLRVRTHSKKLPGKPDILLPDPGAVIFMNGCLWHGHRNCRRARLPTTNKIFWRNKIAGNMVRDRRQHRMLRKSGLKVLQIWTCQPLNDLAVIKKFRQGKLLT